MEETVEICEWIEGGLVVRKTANGVDMPIPDPNLPGVIISRKQMTAREFKEEYGDFFDHAH